MDRVRKQIAVGLWTALLALGLSSPCSGDPESADRVLAPVTVTGQRDLDFEDVFPGVNHSVTVTDLTSGKWLITGDAWTWVDLSFPGLPATLSDGGSTIPIVYSASDAAYYRTDDPGSATSFDPSAGTSAMLWGDGTLYVWLGGTAQPSASATAGTYTATITLESDYSK
jgi:hypothetical protein